MSFSFRQLRIVDAITREGGAGAAARRLRLTQPAVSHALRKLEQDLGLELFARNGHGMQATEAGRRVGEVARRVLGDLERLRFDLEQLGADRQGRLRVATECYTCYRWLPSVIRRFRSEFPGFEVEIVPEAASDPYRALGDREVELVITHSQRRGREFSQRPLFRDELLAIVPLGHPLADKTHLEPADFAGQTVVVHSDPENSILMRRFLAPAEIRPKGFLSLQLTTAVLEAVRADLGITVLAQWVAAEELAAGGLVGRSLGAGGLFRDWSVTTLATDAERPAIAAFRRLVESDLRLLGTAPLTATTKRCTTGLPPAMR